MYITIGKVEFGDSGNVGLYRRQDFDRSKSKNRLVSLNEGMCH